MARFEPSRCRGWIGAVEKRPVEVSRGLGDIWEPFFGHVYFLACQCQPGAGDIFLDLRAPFSGAGIFLFPEDRMQAPPGAGSRSELRRAKRAGAQNSIRDAGALRTPAPTKDFLFLSMFLSFGSQVFVIFLQFWSMSGAKCSYRCFLITYRGCKHANGHVRFDDVVNSANEVSTTF